MLDQLFSMQDSQCHHRWLITGLSDRKSEYLIRSVVWLFDERVGLYDY